MNKKIKLGIVLKADGSGLISEVRLTKEEMKKLKGSSSAAAKSLEGYGKKTRSASRSTRILKNESQGLGRQLNSLKTTLIGVSAAFGIREIVATTDSYNNMESSIRVLTGSQTQAVSIQRQLLEVANDTFSGVKSTVQMYTRFGHATKELGLSQFQLKDITTAVNQSLRISGATTQEAASTALQLAQGLGAGALQGEEFRAMSESNVRMLRLLADHLNVGTGALKKMAADGKLTARVIVDALVGGLKQLNKEAALIAPTTERAWGVFKNNLGQLVHEFDKLTSSSQTLVGGIQAASDIVSYFSDNIELLDNFMESGIIVSIGLLTAWLYRQSAAFVAAAVSAATFNGVLSTSALTTRGLAVSMAGLRTATAFLTGPIGLAIIAAGLLTWSKNARDAALPTQQLKQATNDLTKAISKNSLAMLNNVKIREEMAITKIDTSIIRMQSEQKELDATSHRYKALTSVISKMLKVRLEHYAIVTKTEDALSDLNKPVKNTPAITPGTGTKKKDDIFDAQVKAQQNYYNNLLNWRDQFIESQKDEGDNYLDNIDRLDELADRGWITTEQYNQMAAQMQLTFNGAADDLIDTTSRLSDEAMVVEDSFKSAFKDIVKDGEIDFDRLTESIAGKFIDIAVDDIFNDMFSNIGGGAAGGLFGGLGDWIGGLFGGGKASGGAVSGGAFYQVNERGPELLNIEGRDFLMMGGKDGYVTPMTNAVATASAAPGQGSNVTVIVQNNSKNSESRIEQSSDANGDILTVFIDEVDNALASRVNRGSGALSQSMEGTYGLNRAAGSVR